MNDWSKFIIEPLSPAHDRPGFTCGIDSLDNYIKRQANQDIKRQISRVYVAVTIEKPNKIMGYYTLSSLSIELNQLPEEVLKKLPKHPIPAALLGRLAVDKSVQGNGIGKMLLADALKRILVISDEIAIYAVVVDAINVKAKGFYTQYGFQSLGEETPRLFLPLKAITFSFND
ncbi:MAG: GNAT family N-acetyltransferase [Desulfatiglans sp.]|jgi:GNAT superfamily N-acetyltransferase|nr:GNAT family N-acetyltransferase [Desulfatiglans sp.]